MVLRRFFFFFCVCVRFVLFCFFQERQREEESREVEAGHGHIERGEKGRERGEGKREGRREGGESGEQGSKSKSKRVRGKRSRRGQATPFIVGWAILQLQGNCGEAHNWLLSGNCEGGVYLGAWDIA